MVLNFNEQSAWLYPSFLTDSLKMDYPLYSRPLPSEKIGEGVSVGKGGDCAQASLRRIVHF